jgi:hypothetical protein
LAVVLVIVTTAAWVFTLVTLARWLISALF